MTQQSQRPPRVTDLQPCQTDAPLDKSAPSDSNALHRLSGYEGRWADRSFRSLASLVQHAGKLYIAVPNLVSWPR